VCKTVQPRQPPSQSLLEAGVPSKRVIRHWVGGLAGGGLTWGGMYKGMRQTLQPLSKLNFVYVDTFHRQQQQQPQLLPPPCLSGAPGHPRRLEVGLHGREQPSQRASVRRVGSQPCSDTLLPLTRRVTPPNTASVTQKCAKFEPDSAFTVHR